MRHLSSYLCLIIGWGAFWQVFSCFGLLSGGRKSDPDALDRALIELEGGLSVDHHDDPRRARPQAQSGHDQEHPDLISALQTADQNKKKLARKLPTR